MAEAIDIRELNIRIEQQSAFVTNLVAGMDRVIVGQKHLVDSLLIGLLSDGHILLEGVPGLAKTLAIKTLAQLIDSDYSRIQFTPDLLPADVIGTMIYSQKDEKFQVKKGPVFANFVLADEINRAPAKVQSALLEAMQEKQVTIGSDTFLLPNPFLVMATQNPKYWSGLPCPPPGDLPDPGVKPASLMFSVLAGGFFTTSTNWEGIKVYNYIKPLNHLEYSKTS